MIFFVFPDNFPVCRSNHPSSQPSKRHFDTSIIAQLSVNLVTFWVCAGGNGVVVVVVIVGGGGLVVVVVVVVGRDEDGDGWMLLLVWC